MEDAILSDAPDTPLRAARPPLLPRAHAPCGVLPHSFAVAFAAILSIFSTGIHELVIRCLNGSLLSPVETRLTSRPNTQSEKMLCGVVSPTYKSCIVLFLLLFHQSLSIPHTAYDSVHLLSLHFVQFLNAIRSFHRCLEGKSFGLELKHNKGITYFVHRVLR